MNAQEIAQKNKILEFRIGSNLYGTNTPNSDEDFSGVFMPHETQLFGFEVIEQVDLSVVSKKSDGKNDKDAIDIVLYDFRKFIRLALANNPNILEMLFINKPNIIFANEFGRELLLSANLFPHQGLKQKFLGYAFSQKHKMVIRSESYTDLEDAYKWLTDYISRPDYIDEKRNENPGKTLLVEVLDKLPRQFFQIKGDNIKCGDLNFQRHFMLRKVLSMITDRLSKATNRKDLMTKFGYDTKFGSHLVRLMLEGKELLTTGRLNFPLSYADVILDIKAGKWKQQDVLDYAEEIEAEIENLVQYTDLPKKPRYDEIQDKTIKMIKGYLKLKGLI